MATGKGKRNTTTIDATKHQAATTTQQKAQNTSAVKNTAATTTANKAVGTTTQKNQIAVTNTPTTTSSTPAKAVNTNPVQNVAPVTTAQKANPITASTATQNVAPISTPQKAQVTSTTAYSPETKAITSNNIGTTATGSIATPNTTAAKANNLTASSATKNVSPVTAIQKATPQETKNDILTNALTANNLATPTTSTGVDAFPSLQDALEAAAAAAGVAGGVNVQELNNAINPNSAPAEKTNIWGRVIDNLLDSADMLAGSNTNVQQDILRRNARANKGHIEDEDLTMGKGNPYSDNSLYDALSNAAADALAAYGLTAGNGTTPGTLSQQILDPERYGSLPNPGTAESDALLNAIINATGGGSRSGGTSKGRYSGASGASDLTGLAGGLGEYDLNSLMDLINTRLAEYDNGYNTLMEYLLNAYNANYSSLNDAYMAALNQLGLNYNDTESLLNDRLANSRQELEDARTRALQEAYIQRMLEEKNLADRLGAYGLSGGATESVMANLLNNYRNNRNAVETNTQNSLRDLLQTYLENINTARQNYNKGLLDAENNRLSAAQNLANNLYSSQANAASQYTNQRANTYEDLYNTLANIYAAQAKAALK